MASEPETPGHGQPSRWEELRAYLKLSQQQATDAASYGDRAGISTVRFRAEALGYRRALEKMMELEAAGDA